MLYVLLLVALPSIADERVQNLWIESDANGNVAQVVGICGRANMYSNGGYNQVGPSAFHSGTDLMGMAKGLTIDNASSYVIYAYNGNAGNLLDPYWRVGTNHRCRLNFNYIVSVGVPGGVMWSMDVNKNLNWVWN